MIRRWFSAESRLRRQIRRESYVYCSGDTATHYTGIDFDYCSREGCDWPNGGECSAGLESEERYKAKCAAAGIEP